MKGKVSWANLLSKWRSQEVNPNGFLLVVDVVKVGVEVGAEVEVEVEVAAGVVRVVCAELEEPSREDSEELESVGELEPDRKPSSSFPLPSLCV